jgi:hypothetical protein
MLSPLTPSALNRKSPASPLASGSIDSNMPSVLQKAEDLAWDEETSSPFVTELAMDNVPLPKSSPLKTIIDAAPVKMPIIEDNSPSVQLRLEAAPFTICEDETSMPPPKSTVPLSLASPLKKSTATLDLDVTDNDDQEENIDDTCFSAFSEIPNADMTRFSQLSQRSPTKQLIFDSQVRYPTGPLIRSNKTQITPRPTLRATPATQRTALPGSPSATPTPHSVGGTALDNDTTNLLLDFTQQFEALSSFSQRLSSMTRRVSTAAHPPALSGLGGSTPPLRSHLQVQRTPRAAAAPPRTPAKNGGQQQQQQLLDLLDFDLPPAPTPRSAPTISVRELESVKAQFASQVSALKATLSGREAEVEALKRAVGDAERRVGEAAEQLREERGRREGAERERGEWERRGREFEDVLRKVRADVMSADEERGALAARCDEAEERAREAEGRCAEAEADTRAARAAADAAAKVPVEGSGGDGAVFTAEQVQRQIDEKVHALSRELHAIYKKKHVTKVAGLKKGFEAKTREKTAQLQARVDELERQCEELQGKIDGTLSGVLATTLVTAAPVPAAEGVSAEQREAELKKMEEQAAAIEKARAELAGRDEELRATKAEFAAAMAALEQERVEKGELVAAVDEMLALQADVSVLGGVAGVVASANIPAAETAAAAADDALRRSGGTNVPRPSGLARPRFGIPTPGRSGVAPPSGLARPQAGVAGKSRMMSNIERMGGVRCD